MGNPEPVDLPIVTNFYNLIFTIAAIVFLCIVAWKAGSAYFQDEDTQKMWKRIGIGFPISILIWRGYDVIQIFLEIWDKLKQGTGI